MQCIGLSFSIRIAVLLIPLVQGLRTRGQTATAINDEEAYAFSDFVREFGRTYESDGAEYSRRSAIFQESMAQIHAENSRAGRSWSAGTHPFMDWTEGERSGRLHGYVPSLSRLAVEPRAIAVLQTAAASTSSSSMMRVYGQGSDSFENPTPPVRMQGVCGSCWAIASAEAVEAQILKTNSSMFQDKGSRLSIQTLLNCVQNPKHCGGKGGCDGATTELAFEYVQESGLPLEADVPYQFADGTCNVKPFPSNWARATISGWRALPSNQAQPLMQAIVETGPVVVSVAAWKGWYHYKFGIYNDCEKDVVLNHGLLAKGYGAEDQVGKYWLLQNSWGERWGEQGTIRLLRHDDEDHWCGSDTDPQKGSGCDGETSHSVTVCGSCGILYDSVVPQAGHVSFPDHAIDENYQNVVAASDANLMLSTVGDSADAREDHLPASKDPSAEELDQDNSSFAKVQGLVSQHSETLTHGAEDSERSTLGDVLPSAQELPSSLGDDSLARVPSMSVTSAPQGLLDSIGDDNSITQVPLQSKMSLAKEVQSLNGDDSINHPPSQSEMSTQQLPSDSILTRPTYQSEISDPHESQSSAVDDGLTQPLSQSELRSFGVSSAMSGTSAPQEELPQSSLSDGSSSVPVPSESPPLQEQQPLSAMRQLVHEVQSSLGDGSSSSPSRQPSSSPQSRDLHVVQELQGVLGASLSKRDKAMLDLRRWR